MKQNFPAFSGAHQRSQLAVFFSLALLFVACGEAEKQQHSPEISLETAQLVSHVSSGMINAREALRVRFVQPVVAENRVGHTLSEPVFTFTPKIDGIARWVDWRTLEFKPNAPLPALASYSGSLDMAALFPRNKSLTPLEFTFTVAGVQVSAFEMEFTPQSPAQPYLLSMHGVLNLTQAVQLSDVEQALIFRIDEKKSRLSVSGDETGTSFTFRSPPFSRTEKARTLELTVAKGPLKLAASLKKETILPAKSLMQVQSITKLEQSKNPGLQLAFSDELDPRQNLAGLISIEPEVGVTLTRSGREVLISGNFEHGSQYTLTVHPGIRSRWGTKTQKTINRPIVFADKKPRLRFSGDGVILPAANKRRLRFQTLNLERVYVEIKRVFESNIGQFLQTEQLDSRRTRNRSFNNMYVNRVGVIVVQDTLIIGDTRNKWLQHELNLAPLLDKNKRGLYLVKLSFGRDDMLYGQGDEARQQYYYGPDYYSNPLSPGYVYAHGAVYKPILLSDIGLTLKQAGEDYLILATNIEDAAPISGVRISLRSLQNQELAAGTTGSEGTVTLSGIRQDVFYVLGELGEQQSVLKLNEMAWNNSTFETGGVESSAEGLNAFIYTERGVYRPGDDINLSVIVRTAEGSFPQDHPLSLRLYNPRNRLIVEAVQRRARDGFYSFALSTADDAPTGIWRAEINAGSRTFQHRVRIETVAPQRLKVSIEAEKSELHKSDRELRFSVISNWLFGNPAAGLDASATVTLAPTEFSPEGWPGYSFRNETVEYPAKTLTIFGGKLDQQGRATVRWALPDMAEAPSVMQAKISATVLEKGGRPNTYSQIVRIHPFDYYVGLKKPDLSWGYANTGEELELQAVLLDTRGEPVAGRELRLRIYRGRDYWWWEYDSFDDFRLKFRTDSETRLLEERTLVSAAAPLKIPFTPEQKGQYLIELQEDDGHRAAFFIESWPWGAAPQSMKDAGNLTLKADRSSYSPGQTATVSFLAPDQGTVFFSLEKGDEVLERRILTPSPRDGEMQIQVPITSGMLPNVYAAVSIIQPHSRTANDRPLRMYGILPLMVVDSTTRQELVLSLPDELESGEPFRVELQTADEKPTQVTVAVVDEGLLALTGFRTPEPWRHFYKKVRLGVQTYDLFSFVLGANKGDIFRTFSIGGDFAAERMAALDFNDRAPEEARKAKRFKPVSLFRGPLMTDENGRLTLDFDMPDYIGAVRVMAVAANRDRYGHADKTVPVKKDVMLVPSLPRVLGPGDSISVPVTIFTMRDGIGKVELAIELDGPIGLLSPARHTLNFDKRSEKDVSFTLQAREAIGQAKITFIVRSARAAWRTSTDIEVRPSSPLLVESTDYKIAPGEKLTLELPDKGMPGSNRAVLSLSLRPPMDIDRRLGQLIRYPYGCIEQIVSAVFPQLTLSSFISDGSLAGWTREQIDKNINAGIQRLRAFQRLDGSFSYWPGTDQVSDWGSNYAGHFLIEARRLGYNVPETLLAPWLRYQQKKIRSTRLPLLSRVYKAYLLALADKPAYSTMNLLKENNLRDMNDTEKWLLAGAYKIAGVDRVAEAILRDTGTTVRNYRERAQTYGSTLRDQAIILENMVLADRMDEASQIAKTIAATLSSDLWLSTQETGFALLAMGKFLQKVEGTQGQNASLAGNLRLPSGEKIIFDSKKKAWSYEFTEGFGEKAVLELDRKSGVTSAFVTLTWEGIPLRGAATDAASNLGLTLRWLNEDGAPIDVKNLRQGQVFWGHFRVAAASGIPIEEIALEQILPAGWEVENTRQRWDELPGWMNKWLLHQEEYLDIRDDRIRWFFDLPATGRKNSGLDFVVKLRAVTPGRYTLPPAQVQAMYDQSYYARRAGGDITVAKK